MLYQVKLAPKAEKELNNLNHSEKSKVLKQLVYLTANPFLGKKLKGEWSDFYSLRSWPYRIIYQIYKHELIIMVVAIGHRQGVYK
jgi:mRNA interferase RelE/StbE